MDYNLRGNGNVLVSQVRSYINTHEALHKLIVQMSKDMKKNKTCYVFNNVRSSVLITRYWLLPPLLQIGN